MSDRLAAQVQLEWDQLHRLLDRHRRLLNACTLREPDDIEISALAAVLHSLYNGIENILKRIAIESGDPPLNREYWHKYLLDAMAQATDKRTAVISRELRAQLLEYMEFRHVFRHAYVFDLRWAKMDHLVLHCEEVLHRLENEVNQFMAARKRSSSNEPNE